VSRYKFCVFTSIDTYSGYLAKSMTIRKHIQNIFKDSYIDTYIGVRIWCSRARFFKKKISNFTCVLLTKSYLKTLWNRFQGNAKRSFSTRRRDLGENRHFFSLSLAINRFWSLSPTYADGTLHRRGSVLKKVTQFKYFCVLFCSNIPIFNSFYILHSIKLHM
jgi:hypothetical protein